MYLFITMTVVYSELENRYLLHLVFTPGSYSATALSLFLEGMQYWWWVQMISGITLVKIYSMPPKSSWFFPFCIYPRRSCPACGWLPSERPSKASSGPLQQCSAANSSTQSGLCHCRNSRGPAVLPESLKWLEMKIKSSFNNNQSWKVTELLVSLFFFSTSWLTRCGGLEHQTATYSQWRCSRVKSVNLFLIRFAPQVTPTKLYKDLRVKERSVVSW